MKTKVRKPNKYCKLYGVELNYEKGLNDAETRLYYLYLRIVDWDTKHKEAFGSTDISIRNLRLHYLPNWSMGKISYTRRSLIRKGWFEEMADGRITIKNYFMYRLSKVQLTERYIQQTRQGVQINEQTVQWVGKSEKERSEILRQKISELSNKTQFPRSTD